jgi:hypothetical protein
LCVGMMGGDVEAAAFTAENAARHNALLAIPVLLEIAGVVMSVAEIYEAYQEGGAEGALKQAAFEGALHLAGGGMTRPLVGLAKMAPNLTKAAFFRKMLDNPFAQKLMQKGKGGAPKASSSEPALKGEIIPPSKTGAPLKGDHLMDAPKGQKPPAPQKPLSLQGANSNHLPNVKPGTTSTTQGQPLSVKQQLNAMKEGARPNSTSVTKSLPAQKARISVPEVRPGQEWRQKVHGTAQKTGTPGHNIRSMRVAIEAAKKPDTLRVHLDHGYNRVTGEKIKSNCRPDVSVVKTDGTVHPIEVPSKTDNLDFLRERNDEALSKLPKEMRGEFDFAHIKKEVKK